MAHKKVIAAVVAVTAGAAVSVAAVAQPGEQPRVSVQAPVAAADKGLAATISILDRPRTAADNLPDSTAKGFSQAQPGGVNGSLARKAFSTATTDVFVAPGDGFACIITTPRDGTSFTECQPVESVKAGTNRPATNVEYDRVTNVGLVPDGVDSVEVTFADGTQRQQPVAGNVYMIETTVGNQATAVAYDGPNGRVELETIQHDPERFKNLRDVAELRK